MTNNFLYIDSSNPKKVIIKLFTDNKIKVKSFNSQGNLAKHFLKILNNFLKFNKITFTDISKIGVSVGPGSYTSLRIGVSIANALSYSLNIPIIAISGDLSSSELLKNLKDKTSQNKFITKINYQHDL